MCQTQGIHSHTKSDLIHFFLQIRSTKNRCSSNSLPVECAMTQVNLSRGYATGLFEAVLG
jgi:hypothetical protein